MAVGDQLLSRFTDARTGDEFFEQLPPLQSAAGVNTNNTTSTTTTSRETLRRRTYEESHSADVNVRSDVALHTNSISDDIDTRVSESPHYTHNNTRNSGGTHSRGHGHGHARSQAFDVDLGRTPEKYNENVSEQDLAKIKIQKEIDIDRRRHKVLLEAKKREEERRIFNMNMHVGGNSNDNNAHARAVNPGHVRDKRIAMLIYSMLRDMAYPIALYCCCL